MWGEWKFVSMEPFIQFVTIAGIIMMLKWYAIESMEVDTVSSWLFLYCYNIITSCYITAIIVGEVHPSFPFPLRSRYLVQDVMCNGTESSISQCGYNPHISPECYVGNHSAAVACREGITL